jgi:hypothetical protein
MTTVKGVVLEKMREGRGNSPISQFANVPMPSTYLSSFPSRAVAFCRTARPIFVIPAGKLKNLQFVDREIRHGG